MAVLRRHAGVQATLFELPATAAIARPHLTTSPLAPKIRIIEGDFFTDPLPEGHDAVILANVIHMFSPEHNLALLRRIRERVPDGACLLLVDLWTDATHSQPTFAALLAGEFQIASGEGPPTARRSCGDGSERAAGKPWSAGRWSAPPA